MSHFSTAVIIKNIEDLDMALAPYQEGGIGDCPTEFLEFRNIDMEEVKKDYEAESEKVKAKFPTLTLYIENGLDYSYNEELKQYGYYFNPNAKWDWWTLCDEEGYGRFQNKDIPKGFCQIKDLDMGIDQEKYDYALRFWELKVEEEEPQTKEEEEMLKFCIYKKEFYIDKYETKEAFALASSTFNCWAFILNGEWFEKGEMGWFCFNNSTKESEKNYLNKWNEIINDEKYKDYFIAIVDCHI